MLSLDKKINFNQYSAEELYVNSGKLKRNIENLIKDLNSIPPVNSSREDDFIKINIGMAGGQIRPIICSFNILKEFLESQYIIANTLSDNSLNLMNQEESE